MAEEKTEPTEKVEQVELPPKPEVLLYDDEMSDNIGQLAMALSKAQLLFKTLVKNVQGYGYKYSDLSSLIDATKDGLAENELAIVQTHTTNLVGGGLSTLITTTMLVHSSGEWIKTRFVAPIVPVKGQTAIHAIGTVATYSRRYAMQSIISVSAEQDTDGAA